MLEKTVKIVGSPFNPSVEIVEDMVMKLHFPYNKERVTIQINPNITHYEEDGKAGNQNIQVKQVFVIEPTDETKTLTFDFGNDNVHKVAVGSKNYEIKLLNIGKQNIDGQDFPEFEFLVKEI